MRDRRKRDVERRFSIPQFAAKLRRLADALEQGKRFQIQIAGERISVPAGAEISIEHERDNSGEEIEFQVRGRNRVSGQMEAYGWQVTD